MTLSCCTGRKRSRKPFCHPPELFDVTNEDNCHKWKDILNEMIEGFEAYRKFEESYITDIKKEKEVNEKVRKSCELLGKWFGSLWD